MTQAVQEAIDRALANRLVVTVVVIDGRVAGVTTTEGSVVSDTPASNEAVSSDPARRTPLERLEAVLLVVGAGQRKESEWAADICAHADFSARELERACQEEALRHARKDYGRDSGARMIDGTALLEFLRLRQAVQNGDRAQPEWWSRVVLGRQRNR